MLLVKLSNICSFSPFRRVGGCLWVLFLLLILFSCKKPTAQYPSNKLNKTDSTELFLKDYNKEIIQKEDSLILNLIQNQTVNFKKSESGLWYFIQKHTQNKLVAEDSIVTINYKIYEIDGNIISQEENKTIHFGKKEVIPGMEEGLKLMRRGEIARFIIPSYLAFGAKGADGVKQNEPIVVVIEIQTP